MDKVGFGGGCHWCTEAVFQQVPGVIKVDQGWIASSTPYDSLSEAVIVYFDGHQINLRKLISIHLKTHSCTSNHSMREKYRSAVYFFRQEQALEIKEIIDDLQSEFSKKILTKSLAFKSFKENKEAYQNYYLKNPDKAFCVRYIEPKIQVIKDHL